MENNFFALMFRMKYIQRWVLMRAAVPETLSTHSAETAVIAHAIAAIGNEMFGRSYNCDAIGMKALYHDAPEILTGDLPTPVKNHSAEMVNACKLIESAAFDRFMSLLPQELRATYTGLFTMSPEEKLIVKSADKLCAYIKCIEEKRAGNGEFDMAYESTAEAVKAYREKLPEVDYFCSNYLGGFYLPLDTLKRVE